VRHRRPFCSGERKKVGGIAGVGVEYGITPNLSAKLEYDYIAADFAGNRACQ
jgi:opacity protein-like surface antigen